MPGEVGTDVVSMFSDDVDLIYFSTSYTPYRLYKRYLTINESHKVLGHHMTWLPYSPELNPVEMIWNGSNCRVEAKQVKAKC